MRTRFRQSQSLSAPPPALTEPLSEAFLEHLLAAGESDLVEFKREWYGIGHAEGKALLAKDVLALANTVRPNAPGFLVIGVDDERRGSRVVGVEDPPDPETISNIVANYVHPPANLQCRHYSVCGRQVSVIVVSWSPARPHHSVREYTGILSTNVVYVRRDRTIGRMTLPEIESMIREKDARLGPLVTREAIQCGFVQKPNGGGSALVARVTNVTTEPVSGVDVAFDVRNARNPEYFYRARKLGNATLGPGESREAELRISEITFYVPTLLETGERQATSPQNFGSFTGDRWLDVTLHVDYRDREGFIRHVEQRVVVDG